MKKILLVTLLASFSFSYVQCQIVFFKSLTGKTVTVDIDFDSLHSSNKELSKKLILRRIKSALLDGDITKELIIIDEGKQITPEDITVEWIQGLAKKKFC